MENVCRTCLRTPDKLLPLFEDTLLINKIETISSIKMMNETFYPATICTECIQNVNTLFNFRKVIINSDKELRERHENLKRTKGKCKKRTKREATEESTEDWKEIKKEEPIEKEEDDFFDSTEPQMENNTDSEGEDTKKMDELDTVKRAIATMKLCKCNDCNKTFTSRFKLYNHRRTEHVAPGICNICGLVVRADNLKRHVQLHSEEPVACKQCGKTFKNSESLRGHLLIHKGETFTCEICGKTSKVKSEHGRHMKTHIDPEVGKVMCTICGKKVRDIKKHMHSHTGERPYICKYCNKGFTSPYSLKVHIRQHTNERPFICEFCPLTFPQKVSLLTHLKSKHNQVTNS